MNRLQSESRRSEAASVSRQARRLFYQRKAVDGQACAVIRSKKTAKLLQLNCGDQVSLASESISESRQRTIQPGGFIRSRITAELLGINVGS